MPFPWNDTTTPRRYRATQHGLLYIARSDTARGWQAWLDPGALTMERIGDGFKSEHCAKVNATLWLKQRFGNDGKDSAQ